MDKFLVAIFNTETAAFEGLSALNALHEQGDLTVYSTAVLAKDAAGVVSMKKAADEGPLGTALGMLTGSLVGVLAGPVGVAVGAVYGAATGSLFDIGKLGVSSTFVEQVSNSLQPGNTAVLAEVEETWVAPVDTRLEPLGAVILRRPRSEAIADQMNQDAAVLEAELTQLQQELAQTSAENKATVQKEIDTVRKELEATGASITAGLESTKHEANSKLKSMTDQLNQAGERKKAQIEQRKAVLKADHAARSAKLEQARKLIHDALRP